MAIAIQSLAMILRKKKKKRRVEVLVKIGIREKRRVEVLPG